MIKSIWWDVGDTVIVWDYVMTCRLLGRFSGKDVNAVRRVFCGCDEWRYAEGSLMWLFDKGLLDEEEFFDILHLKLGISNEVSCVQIREAFTRFFSGSRRTLQVIRYLHSITVDGVRLIQGVVSNNNSLMWQHTLAAFPTLRLCDIKTGIGIMDFHSVSFQLGTRKPESEIFAQSFAASSWRPYRQHMSDELYPDECLFFDDMECNVIAARKFGVQAVLVDRGDESIIEGLLRFGIPVPDENWTPTHHKNIVPLALSIATSD